MRLRPFLKYFGSKHRLAVKYPEPAHDLIVEPFAGSAQYSTLHYQKKVVLVERSQDIADCWNWLITCDPNEVLSLPTELEQGFDLRGLDAPHGAKVLVRVWQRVGRNDCWTVSKWNGINSGMWCKETRDAIAHQLDSIRHWSCICGDAFEFMTACAELEATWFIDPPYSTMPATVYGADAPPIDYDALAMACVTRNGQTIVCGVPEETWLPFAPLADNTSGRTSLGGTRARKTEGIWTNG